MRKLKRGFSYMRQGILRGTTTKKVSPSSVGEVGVPLREVEEGQL